MSLQPYQQRVVDEKARLDEKLAKLLAFRRTELFAGLPTSEQVLLHDQCMHMSGYSEVLGKRIAAFHPNGG